jgi:hypothetical protein
MPRIGSNAAPDLAQWRYGGNKQQLSGRLTMPERGRITHVGAWIRGVSGYGSIAYRLCVWDWGGSVSSSNGLLGRSGLKSSTPAAFAIASLERVYWPLEVPVELDEGKNFMVGISSDTAGGSAVQWGLASGGTHYAKDFGNGADWPAGMKGCYAESNDLSAWVESYTAVGSAQVRRSGAWVQASAVQLRRSGAWVAASSVQIRRSGAWVDAS